MNCSYHPDKKAPAQCSACRKLLCDDCVVHTKDNTILCSHCAVIAALKDCVESNVQRLKGKKQQKELQGKEAKKKDKRQKWVVIGIIAGIVLIGNALIYYFTPIPQAETFAPHNNPMAVAAMIDAAIKKYAQDHDGHVPEALDQLYGKYIPKQILSTDVLKRFDYNKATDTVYELIVRTADNQRMPDIRFTQGGVAPLPTH
jgi:hypothetical protein